MIFEEMLTKECKDAFVEKKRVKAYFDKEFFELTEEYIYSEQFDNDIRRIIAKDYYFDLPRCSLIKKSLSNRRRKVFMFENHNKIVLQYLNFMLCRKYDHIWSDSLYSARICNRTRNLFYTIKKLDPERKLYAVKSDIRKYSESIDLDIIEKQLWEKCSDEPEFIDFIMWVMRRGKYYFRNEVTEGYTSVMGGNPTASFFYNLNLIHVDEVMAERCALYCRYADDICIICNTKEEAEANWKLLNEMVSDLHIEFNLDKTEILGPGEAIDLLGIKFANGYTDMADNTYNKVIHKFQHRANSLNRSVRKGRFTREKAAEIMTNLINGYLYGYQREDDDLDRFSWVERIFPVITSTERLKRIDHVAEDCIRFVGTGRKTNAKYRVKYSDIKRYGYRPLVHSYYHRFENETED